VNAACVQMQWDLEAAKALGPTLAILAAALAWLINKALTWSVWAADRFIIRLEMMNALYADIATNLESERAYANKEDGERFLQLLTANLPLEAPFVPYIAVEEKNLVFNEAGTDLRSLPPDIVLAVVKYYNASAGLSRQLADFRSDAYLKIGRRRQEGVFIDAYGVGRKVCELGDEALRQLASRRRFYDASRLAFLTAMGIAGFLVLAYAAVTLPHDSRWLSAAAEWASSCGAPPGKTPS